MRYPIRELARHSAGSAARRDRGGPSEVCALETSGRGRSRIDSGHTIWGGCRPGVPIRRAAMCGFVVVVRFQLLAES